jgi:hypothetical protein
MRKKSYRPTLETLDARIVPTAYPNYWRPASSSAGDTAWSNGASWSEGHKPTTQEQAIFDISSSYNCTLTPVLGGSTVVAALVLESGFSHTLYLDSDLYVDFFTVDNYYSKLNGGYIDTHSHTTQNRIWYNGFTLACNERLDWGSTSLTYVDIRLVNYVTVYLTGDIYLDHSRFEANSVGSTDSIVNSLYTSNVTTIHGSNGADWVTNFGTVFAVSYTVTFEDEDDSCSYSTGGGIINMYSPTFNVNWYEATECNTVDIANNTHYNSNNSGFTHLGAKMTLAGSAAQFNSTYDLTIVLNGTIYGTGTVSTGVGYTITCNGTIDPGGVGDIGYLTFVTDQLYMGTTSAYSVDVVSSVIYDAIYVDGDFVTSAYAQLNVTNLANPGESGTLTIVSGTGDVDAFSEVEFHYDNWTYLGYVYHYEQQSVSGYLNLVITGPW